MVVEIPSAILIFWTIKNRNNLQPDVVSSQVLLGRDGLVVMVGEIWASAKCPKRNSYYNAV